MKTDSSYRMTKKEKTVLAFLSGAPKTEMRKAILDAHANKVIVKSKNSD